MTVIVRAPFFCEGRDQVLKSLVKCYLNTIECQISNYFGNRCKNLVINYFSCSVLEVVWSISTWHGAGGKHQKLTWISTSYFLELFLLCLCNDTSEITRWWEQLRSCASQRKQCSPCRTETWKGDFLLWDKREKNLENSCEKLGLKCKFSHLGNLPSRLLCWATDHFVMPELKARQPRQLVQASRFQANFADVAALSMQCTAQMGQLSSTQHASCSLRNPYKQLFCTE